MEFRTFRKPEPKSADDGRPKPFGRRRGAEETAVERPTASRMLKALLLGLGVGALASICAGPFL